MRYMKAALLRSPGHLTVDEVPVPSCPESGILVEVKACAICTSDAKMAKSGHPALIYPRILGHEVSGVVMESRSLEVREGKRVQIFPGLRCKKCIAWLRCQGGDIQAVRLAFSSQLLAKMITKCFAITNFHPLSVISNSRNTSVFQS